MGLLDNVKKAANAAREQAGELAGKHGDKIDSARDNIDGRIGNEGAGDNKSNA